MLIRVFQNTSKLSDSALLSEHLTERALCVQNIYFALSYSARMGLALRAAVHNLMFTSARDHRFRFRIPRRIRAEDSARRSDL